MEFYVLYFRCFKNILKCFKNERNSNSILQDTAVLQIFSDDREENQRGVPGRHQPQIVYTFCPVVPLRLCLLNFLPSGQTYRPHSAQMALCFFLKPSGLWAVVWVRWPCRVVAAAGRVCS